MAHIEYVLDTETTGLRVQEDRITEIAICELIDKSPTGRVFHKYINPERLQTKIAKSITGLSDEFLSKQKVFAQICKELIEFLGPDEYYIVAHNARFDLKFLNMEFSKCSSYFISESKMIDTLDIAKQLFPKKKNSLDALCDRFSFSLKDRNYHGALIDTQLLTKVYLRLFHLSNQSELENSDDKLYHQNNDSCINDSNVVLSLSDDEKNQHQNILNKIKQYV